MMRLLSYISIVCFVNVIAVHIYHSGGNTVSLKQLLGKRNIVFCICLFPFSLFMVPSKKVYKSYLDNKL